MSGVTETELISGEASLLERVSAATVGVGFLAFLAGWVVLFELVDPTMVVAGLSVYDWLGVAMLLGGVGIAGFGVASRFGLAPVQPSSTAGVLTGVVFASVWFVVFGLVVSQTLGINGPLGLGWLLPSLVGGGAVFAATVVPREDIGSTLPAGLFGAVAGLVVLADVIGPEWTWRPGGLEPTFSADIAVPVMAIVAGLVLAWAAAKAYEGFGSRGRQAGAYLMVSLNAFLMIAVLFLLVAFIVGRGLPGLLAGVQVGFGVGPEVAVTVPFVETTLFAFRLPVEVPFVMNSYGLRNNVNGVLPAIYGTFWLALGAVIVSVPTGVGAAVFLTEYADQGRFTQVIEVATNGLWSTPSIVYGLFGAAFLVPRFANNASLLSGQLVLGFMLLPLVVITTREAIKSVPDGYRDASAALGVSKWETIRSVVLPAALPGVVTGVILGVGRIAGETAPILLVASASMSPFPDSRFVPHVLAGFEFTASPPFVTNDVLLSASSALPYQLFALVTAGVSGGAGDAADINPWSTALVLLIVVLSFYAVGIASRSYFRRKLRE